MKMGKMKPERIARFAIDLLFPPRCVFCGAVVPPGSQICRECAAQIRPSGEVRCEPLPLRDRKVLCAFLYPYEGKVRDSVLDFKFHGRKENAAFYAGQLAARVRLAFPGAGFDFVTSVPLSAERKKERGYDQSELVAAKLARELGVPYRASLKKVRGNRVQHLLGRLERAENVKGVYRLVGQDAADGKRILLVDDIVTTGYTLAECASVLLCGGAADVSCAAVAKAFPEQVENSRSL